MSASSIRNSIGLIHTRYVRVSYVCVCIKGTFLRIGKLFSSAQDQGNPTTTKSGSLCCCCHHTVPPVLKLSTLWQSRYNSSRTLSCSLLWPVLVPCFLPANLRNKKEHTTQERPRKSDDRMLLRRGAGFSRNFKCKPRSHVTNYKESSGTTSNCFRVCVCAVFTRRRCNRGHHVRT